MPEDTHRSRLTIGFVYDAKCEYRALGFNEEQIAEFDADETIDFVAATLRSLGHEVTCVGHVRNLVFRLARGERWDLVFNIAEGLTGPAREAQVPGLLEAFGIPCAMSDPKVMAVALDKALTKRVVRDLGFRTPPFVEVRRAWSLPDLTGLEFPLFAKPVAEGSSKGISALARVTNAAELMRTASELITRFEQPVLVEAYLPGREFTVGIWERDGRPAVLGVLEIAYRARDGHDYNCAAKKEVAEDVSLVYRLVDDPIAREAAAMALGIFVGLGCRDIARVDLRCDADGVPHFLEINPLPGLRPQFSELMQLAEKAGHTPRDVIDAIVRSAAARFDLMPAPPSTVRQREWV